MHFIPLTLLSLPPFLTTSLSKASAIATSPSGPGILQIQNGTHVYGCINSDSLFVPVEDEGGEFPQCNTFTANATTGRIGWQGVFLGIPDAFPQPLLLFGDEGKGIQWVSSGPLFFSFLCFAFFVPSGSCITAYR